MHNQNFNGRQENIICNKKTSNARNGGSDSFRDKNKQKKASAFKSAISIFLSFISLSVASICFIMQLPTVITNNEVAITTTAAGLALPDGVKTVMRDGFYEEKEDSRPNEATTSSQTQNSEYEASLNQNVNTSTNAVLIETEKNVPDSIPIGVPHCDPDEGEATYPVNERHIGSDGITYENFSVKNYTETQIDVGEELSKTPDIKIDKNSPDPQVLIYHTHTTEAYMTGERSVYPQNFYARSTEKDYNVTSVGNEICKKLQQSGISVVHDTTLHDNPGYTGSYYRSEDTVKELLAKYPSIKMTIDIHRDSMGSDKTGHTKPTFSINGEKAAQVMIISGSNKGGKVNFPDWEYNLRMGVRLQQKIETMYPGMTRPLKFCDSQYNLYLTHNSLLIEVGSDVNTIDEVKRSGQYVGESLSNLLNSL